MFFIFTKEVMRCVADLPLSASPGNFARSIAEWIACPEQALVVAATSQSGDGADSIAIYCAHFAGFGVPVCHIRRVLNDAEGINPEKPKT